LDWQVGDLNWPVQYCLSEPFQDRCKLEVNIGILVVVAVCNLAKVICMLAAFRVIRRSPLITVRDATASFPTNADQTTAQRYLLSRRDVQPGKWKSVAVPMQWHGSKGNTVRRVAGCKARYFYTLVTSIEQPHVHPVNTAFILINHLSLTSDASSSG
jgi:hypothetical protein